MSSDEGWIGVDLDGTLAFFDKWRGEGHIGAPIQPMIERVKRWILAGWEVRIFTARVCPGASRDPEKAEEFIRAWCKKHIGVALPVTCIKDFRMIQQWDDRCVQLVTNTGMPVDPLMPRY